MTLPVMRITYKEKRAPMRGLLMPISILERDLKRRAYENPNPKVVHVAPIAHANSACEVSHFVA